MLLFYGKQLLCKMKASDGSKTCHCQQNISWKIFHWKYHLSIRMKAMELIDRLHFKQNQTWLKCENIYYRALAFKVISMMRWQNQVITQSGNCQEYSLHHLEEIISSGCWFICQMHCWPVTGTTEEFLIFVVCNV